MTELLPGFMAGWRDRKKQEDKKGNNFHTREDYWNSDKLKLQFIDIVNLYNSKICRILSKTKLVLIRID